MLELLTSLGIDPSMILAGLFGGICKSAAMRDNSLGSLATSAMVGAGVSNYLGGWISTHSGFDKLGSGFGSGAAGIFIIQGVINTVPKLLPSWIKGNANV